MLKIRVEKELKPGWSCGCPIRRPRFLFLDLEIEVAVSAVAF
jgi:hypothetical protein